MASFNFDLFFKELDSLNEKYHLSSICTSSSKVHNVLSTDIMEAIDKEVNIVNLVEDILECIAPSLDYFVMVSGIYYPYDLNLKLISLLEKAGYPRFYVD